MPWELVGIVAFIAAAGAWIAYGIRAAQRRRAMAAEVWARLAEERGAEATTCEWRGVRGEGVRFADGLELVHHRYDEAGRQRLHGRIRVPRIRFPVFYATPHAESVVHRPDLAHPFTERPTLPRHLLAGGVEDRAVFVFTRDFGVVRGLWSDRAATLMRDVAFDCDVWSRGDTLELATAAFGAAGDHQRASQLVELMRELAARAAPPQDDSLDVAG